MKFDKSESLDRYFKSIRNLNPLTKEAELQLAARIKAGDTRAFNKLIEHNLKIVVSIANKNRGRGIEVDDLIQQGNMGLMEAAERFDADANVRFATFAGTRILKNINKLIDDCGRIVRIPVNQEYQRYLDKKNGKEVENITALKLDDFINNEEDGPSKGDIIGSTCPEIDTHFDNEYLVNKVNSLLRRLSDRDKYIVKLYFGIDNNKEISTKDIAQLMGITQIRVCQIIKSAKDKLKMEV